MPVQAATMGSHYPFGGEGVTAGSAPPPGFHYRGYLTLTNPTTYKDDNGDDLPVDVNVDVVATVHRFLHVTKFQILGRQLRLRSGRADCRNGYMTNQRVSNFGR